MSKHQLISAGAAFNEDGERLFSNTTSGVGSALCSCGWLSEPVEFGRTRKTLHKAHVALIDELDVALDQAEGLADLLGHLLVDAEPEEIKYQDATDSIVIIRTPDVSETTNETDEAPVSGAWPVSWPESVAKLFFRALAKDGALIVAQAYGLTRTCNESKLDLFIEGPADAALTLALELPTIFTAANIALKKWRKTSPYYKRFSLKTPEGRRDAFASEQNFLRDFCHAIAGDFTNDMLASDGVRAGLEFLNDEDYAADMDLL